MMIFDEIIQLMLGLNDDQLKKVRDFILMKLNLYDPLKEIDFDAYFCPVCKSKHIIKFGKKYGKQRYKCKDCGKVFTNTVMKAGNESMPSPTGGTETGHSGNGYCKITWHPSL